MENEKLINYIKSCINRNYVKKDDKVYLQDCLDRLNSGKPLDPTQSGFIENFSKKMRTKQSEYSRKHYVRKVGKTQQ